jgi:hypothetical protein
VTRAPVPAPAAARVLVALAALAALGGCPSSKVGTIGLELTTAPGSMLMDRVVQLRLSFTNPAQEIVLDRTERGFDLALDLPATGDVGALSVDGLDAGGALVATGATPPFPFAAIDARMVVYMAAPMSIGAAPASLQPARTRPSVATLGYGAVFAGGLDAAGRPSDAIEIYNAYDHTLTPGLPMPGARAGVTIAVTSNNKLYLFGGDGPDGAATGTLWFFDTTVMPSGSYLDHSDPMLPFTRTGSAAIPLGGDSYLITGAPPLQLGNAQLAETSEIPALSSGASVLGRDRAITAVVVDDTTGALLRLRAGAIEPLGVQQKGGAAVALPGARVAVIGGEAAPRDAVIVDADTGAITPMPGALAEAYEAIAIAATPRFVVVAGRRAGVAGTAIEVLDATTLERRHATSVADAITAAVALPNGQVLLAGAALQLFTPPPPSGG